MIDTIISIAAMLVVLLLTCLFVAVVAYVLLAGTETGRVIDERIANRIKRRAKS